MMQSWQAFLQTQGGLINPQMQLHFGSPMQERLVLETKNCIVPLTHLGLLLFTGKDAKNFLQGQVTCNFNEINPSKSRLGAHCNLQGRMQCIFRALALDPQETQYGLILPHSMLEITKQTFKKYGLFSQVQIDVSTHVGIGLYGPQMASMLAPFTENQLENPYDCISKKTTEGNYTLCRLNGIYPRYEIWGDVAAIKHLWETLAPDCSAITSNAWDLLDIRAGIPAIYPATANQILPHHANLDILNGISFNKGCYLGQEIVARMQYRGKIKKHLYQAYVPNQAKPSIGMPLVSDNANDAIGTVLQAAENSKGNFEMLVVLDDQYHQFDKVRLNSLEGPPILKKIP